MFSSKAVSYNPEATILSEGQFDLNVGTEIIWRTNRNYIQNVEIFIHEQRIFPDSPSH